ncbi:hypothetical protein BG006_004381 [Podila minutissima]|uniref:Uncharacterized protein n=1 Tax=Podila minutissima TaxID=64525 RepID=A0A9P5S7Z0_9FUNG|nr:hypothetical protein BG006_004381 [Podila minutissima]
MESDGSLLSGRRYKRYSGSLGSSAGASSLNALGETEEESADGNQTSFSIGSPVLLNAPTKKPKERRSKSVIFNSQLQALEPQQLFQPQPPRSPVLDVPAKPRPFSQSSTLAAPTLSLTTSSPPFGPMKSPPLALVPPPLTLGTPEGVGTLGLLESPPLNVPSISVRTADTLAYPTDSINPLSPDLHTRAYDHNAATQAEALGPFATPPPPPPQPPQVAVQDSNEAVVPYIVEAVVTVSGGSARAGSKTPPLGIGLGLQAPDATPLPIFHVTEDSH